MGSEKVNGVEVGHLAQDWLQLGLNPGCLVRRKKGYPLDQDGLVQLGGILSSIYHVLHTYIYVYSIISYFWTH